MLAMQESDVEDLPCFISAMIKNLLVLEERVLYITMFFEIFNVYMCLCNCSSPAIVSQVHSIAESFDTTFKDVVGNILDIKLGFKSLNISFILTEV